MAEIHNISDIRSAREPHIAGEAECRACGHQWVAVAHHATDVFNLECPSCSAVEGRMFSADEVLMKEYEAVRSKAQKYSVIAEAAWAFMKSYQYETAEQADMKRRELFELIVRSVRPR